MGSISGPGRPLEVRMATHSSILAWRIPWTEEPGGLQSMGSQRDMAEHMHTHTLKINFRLPSTDCKSFPVFSAWKCQLVLAELINWSLFWLVDALVRSVFKYFECACMLSCFSHVQVFATLWTVGDAIKVLHSVCQQIWKTQQWPQDWKRSVFIPIPKKGNATQCSKYCTIALVSHASKIMLKIL